jgi:hypothetical protein
MGATGSSHHRAYGLLVCRAGTFQWGRSATRTNQGLPRKILLQQAGRSQPFRGTIKLARLRVLDALDGSTRAEEVLAPASYATSALAPPAEHDEEAARAGMARLFPA